MKIRTRLTLSAFSIVTLAVISIASVMTWTASEQVESGLSLARSDQMMSLQNVTRTAVEQYAQSLESQLLDMADQELVQLATEDFTGAFGGYALFAGQQRVSEHRATVGAYYRQQFLARYTAVNKEALPNTDHWVASMTDNAVTLQSHFIAGNPESAEQRARLNSAPVSSSYNNYHERYHPQLRRFQKRFGLDDILILHPDTGAVVYSVRKQADLGTSLTEGPFRDSALAQLFHQTVSLSHGERVFSDFHPYEPALGRPVGFLGTPITSPEGKMLGVLVFRLNSDTLNELVTYNYDWQASGLGATGTTYLVGPDLTVRTNSRLLIEQPNRFSTQLASKRLPSGTLETIVALRTSVTRFRIETAPAQAALAGESGTQVSVNSWGEPVLAAFGPIDFLGQRWGVISEIHRDEALAEMVQLNRSIRNAALITAGFLALVAAVAGWALSRSMTRPIAQTVDTLNAIADGDGDLTQRLDANRRDELGELAGAFNRFVEKIHDIVANVQTVNAQLNLTTREVQDRAQQAIHSLAEQNEQTDQVSTAMTEMTTSIQNVSQHAQQADQLSRDTSGLSDQGVAEVNDLADTVQRMDARTDQAMQAIAQLNDQTRSIGTILDVIRAIAEQTNLLALNAAIEAARAGEHGRGFAVVADEVRTLANRTQHSTEEIHQMIEALQQGSDTATSVMQGGRAAVADGVVKAESARHTLSQISQAMDEIQASNISVASVVEEQSRVADEINRALLQIRQVADLTARGSEDIGGSVNELSELNGRLQALVGRFKTRPVQ